MASTPASVTENNRAVWSAGDWDRISQYIAPVGPRLLDRLGDLDGLRLLDIGTGSGGTIAVPAAQRGAQVTGADLTDAWFGAARARAVDAGVSVEWVVGDAEALPFEDQSFDVVTSTFGHMFAPDHEAAARELVRVCRPGGRIGLACWTPEGKIGRMFGAIASHLPPPPEGFRPPPLWGHEPHTRGLLEPLGVTVEADRRLVDMTFESADAQVAEYEQHFGPIVTARAKLGDGWPAARADFVAFFESVNEATDGTMSAGYEYLEVVGLRDGESHR